MNPTHPLFLRQEGFNLIAVSVILTAAALVMASLLPGKEAGDYSQKVLTTIDRLDKVEWAMRGYMLKNGRRPCPADGQYDINNHNFGLEAVNPGACTGGTPAAPMGPDAGTGYVVGGVIPTKTLNLPDDYAFDDWGRRFTYVVDTRATASNTDVIGKSTLNSCYVDMGAVTGGGTGGIVIHDGTGATIDNTMYAYISHGPDGHGAWPAQGSSGGLTPAQSDALRINAGSTDTDQLTNAGVDSSFVYNTTNFTNVKVKKDKTATFDDLVYYQQTTKNTCCLGGTANCTPLGFRIDGTAAGDEAGISVAVGDVNGDGIPDIVIGALYANSSNGSIFVVFGTKNGFPDPLPLSSLNGVNGFRLNGVTTEGVGGQIAVGDVNGDGTSDIIIGAYMGTVGAKSLTGKTYVVFGGQTRKDGSAWSTCPCSLNGTFLNGTNGFELDGPTAFNMMGTFVAAGDINGDGKADIIIGDPQAPIGGNSNTGLVYVVFGAASWSSTPYTLDSAFLDGIKGFELDGTTQNSFTGVVVAAGDINGDGKSDIIVGSPFNGTGGSAGSAFVVYGKSSAWTTPQTLNASFLDGTNGFELDGAGASTYLGTDVAAGDINGDGKADIIISGTSASPGGRSQAGSVWVVFGKATAFATPQSVNAAFLNGTNGFELDGAAANYTIGTGLATGDVNGDGKSDIVISASRVNTNTGSIYVVFGGAAGPLGGGTWASGTPYTLNAAFLNGSNGFELDGAATGNFTGSGVAVGDVNKDTYADIIVGAYGAAPNGAQSGSTYVYFGKKTGWPTTPYSLGGL